MKQSMKIVIGAAALFSAVAAVQFAVADAAGHVLPKLGSYQRANFVFLFLTQDALDRFRASEGWTAGAEGGVTVVDASGGFSPSASGRKA